MEQQHLCTVELRPRVQCYEEFVVRLLAIRHTEDLEVFFGCGPLAVWLLVGDSCTVVADEEPYGEWTAPEEDLKILCMPYRE